jgi:hypothetical protein
MPHWVQGLIAALLIALGSFLPWASSGLLSLPGTSGDGVITLVLGVIMGGFAWAARNGARVARFGYLIGAALCFWVSVNTFSNFQDDVASVGTGLVMVVVVSFIAGLFGLEWAFSSKYNAGSQPVEAPVAPLVAAAPAVPVEERLRQLAALRDQGLISGEEWEERRKSILDEL